MSEQSDTQEELPPEIREFMIDKLAEILVLDYRQTHGLVIPTDGALSQKRGHARHESRRTHGIHSKGSGW